MKRAQKASKQARRKFVKPDGLAIRCVIDAAEITTFDGRLDGEHYLGSTPPVGDFLRQIVERDGQPVALLVWGAAALKLKDREAWIGWSVTQRGERLKLVVQNRRFLLLHAKGKEPNLASQTLALACRELPAQWREHFGYAPLLAETFTDPESFEGTCYKASGWEAVGQSQGHSRHRADFYVPNQRPKRLWMRELAPKAREKLRAMRLGETSVAALVPAPGGMLPLPAQARRSLLEAFRHAPDPRGNNARFRIGPVLTLVAMALLAGARDVAQIARFATRLKPQQRAGLSLPIRKGTRRFYEVPTYSVFYQVLIRMDPEAFAQTLNDWLATQAGTLPTALCLDGKMIRELIGTVTLADSESGSPVAVAIMDQKEGTERSEQSAARALIESLPSLEGQTVTADPLHCQRELVRAIVEKGGEYLAQIKGNQPNLLKHAQALCDGRDPLLSKTNSATDASTNVV
ncbi:MAG: ISAs1 family transposase [Nitrospira sp.]|nr:ISAs1 family transposase [Nitrospira sp.]